MVLRPSLSNRVSPDTGVCKPYTWRICKITLLNVRTKHQPTSFSRRRGISVSWPLSHVVIPVMNPPHCRLNTGQWPDINIYEVLIAGKCLFNNSINNNSEPSLTCDGKLHCLCSNCCALVVVTSCRKSPWERKKKNPSKWY